MKQQIPPVLSSPRRASNLWPARFILRPALLLGACLLTVTSMAQPVPPIPGNWQLTFEETFDGSVLDGNKWKMGKADAGLAGDGGNNPDNISLSGGKLTLKATTTPILYCGKPCNYSGGDISTFMNFKQLYGYFEARMRWDQATGLWPAFWLMPERDDYSTKEWFVNSFLKFNLASSGITSVTSAKLRLKVVVVGNDANSPNNLEAFRVANDSWTETGITWNNQPAWNPLVLEQKWGFSAAVGSYIEIDLTKFVQEEIAGDKVVSVALSDTYRRARRMAFHSREVAVAADRPQLIVNGSTFYPTADAIVKWGTAANTNFGTTSEVEVRTAYSASTSSTHNGGMEFDIMETLGVWGPNITSHVLHWDGYASGHPAVGWGPVPVADTTAYHNYGVYWANGIIEFYVDGIKTGAYNDVRAMNVPAYLILSMQLGGWPGSGNTVSAAVNNKTFNVEHVRVWSGTKSTTVPTVTTRKSDGSIAFGTDYTAYGGTGNAGSRMTIADGGTAFSICRNGWMKFPLSYTVTPNTVLEFTVDSSSVGEILGIGLDNDDISDNTKRIFQLAGSQTWVNAWQEAADYVERSGTVTYVINIGAYYTGPMSYLAVAADSDATNQIYGLFSNVKLSEGVATVSIGATNLGVGCVDSRTGTGYLMYSAQNVISRFGAYAGNADHVIAVYYYNGQWQADTNFGQVAFTPVSTDRLLAAVSFSADTVTSLQGVSGTENGIAKGYSSGNLVFTADWWDGTVNDGEFGVTGTTFTP